MSLQTNYSETSGDATGTANRVAAALPPLDSPQFWLAIEPSAADQAELPFEALALSVRQFALRGELDKAQRVFETLYILYENDAKYWVNKYCYSPASFAAKSPQLLEELVQEIWMQVYKNLTSPDPTYQSAYLRNFNVKFIGDVRWLARQQGIEEGYVQSKNKDSLPRRVPHKQQASFTQPLGQAANESEGEQLSLSNIVADWTSSQSFEVINILAKLGQRLDSQQKQILQLLLGGNSKNSIAKTLHIAEKTVAKKMAEIRQIISSPESP